LIQLPKPKTQFDHSFLTKLDEAHYKCRIIIDIKFDLKLQFSKYSENIIDTKHSLINIQNTGAISRSKPLTIL
jgi:hypothetical protein